MCTCRAEKGKRGRSSSASCVEYMRLPLGLRIAMGWRAGRLLMTGASIVQKWAVQPVSAMTGEEARERARESCGNKGGPIGLCEGRGTEESRQVGVTDEVDKNGLDLLRVGVDKVE